MDGAGSADATIFDEPVTDVEVPHLGQLEVRSEAGWRGLRLARSKTPGQGRPRCRVVSAHRARAPCAPPSVPVDCGRGALGWSAPRFAPQWRWPVAPELQLAEKE